ncbi:MAG: RhuM family protein [Desulfobacterales bacterium]|nr:RhuM family protein [Desulfobacterales bacterium]MDD4073400.1 RhuM family protein [Desulfobacterales bacterium]MDD4392008.1 RhuM family protein [Desulfobacterales bacterium]
MSPDFCPLLSPVNSKRGTQFRQWTTSVLREHLVRGFTLNEQRLREQGQKLDDLRRTVGLLEQIRPLVWKRGNLSFIK